MRIPSKGVGRWMREIFDQCTVSHTNRLQRDAVFRNCYLTGSVDGEICAYNETFAFIDNLSSYLYSPVELRFLLSAYGSSSILELAKMRAASSEFHKYFRRSNTDTLLEDAVTWSLVKGKTFIKSAWTSQGFKDVLVQPGLMGVLEENLNSLDDQEVFSHTTYLTPDRLYRKLRTHPDREELMRKAMKYVVKNADNGNPDHDNNLRQIVVGGIQPYKIQGQGGPNNRGNVYWMDAPSPEFSPQVLASLIPIHELWVWDDDRADEPNGIDGEYTTLQFVGEDVVIAGELTHRNIFADQYDISNKARKTIPSEYNPLAGHHPFTEICPNQLDGYFWGRSELCNVGILQKYINSRIEGINQMLRRQEDPPKMFSGVAGIKQAAYSMIKKAGGYMTDSNPNAKVQDIYPTLPDRLFESLHEFLTMFDRMAGFTPTMSGRGEAGVRSQGHSDALTRNASPRFKDRALIIERQLDALGSLKLDMLKAKVAEPITAWVPKAEAGIVGDLPAADPFELAPVPGTAPVEFTFYDLSESCKVSVDSHSSSPAFAQETRTLMFELFKVGAADAEQLIQHLHPPGADDMIDALHRRKAEQAKLLAEHPELAQGAKKKK